jgi:hypothetical protein
MTRQDKLARFDELTIWQPDWNYAQSTDNPWFKHDEWRCTVYSNKKHGGWSYVINDPQGQPSWSRTCYDDKERLWKPQRPPSPRLPMKDRCQGLKALATLWTAEKYMRSSDISGGVAENR